MRTKKICLWKSFMNGLFIGFLSLVFHCIITDDEPNQALIRSWHYYDMFLCAAFCVGRKFFWNIKYFDYVCLGGIFADVVSIAFSIVCFAGIVGTLAVGTQALPFVGFVALWAIATTLIAMFVIGMFVVILYLLTRNDEQPPVTQ